MENTECFFVERCDGICCSSRDTWMSIQTFKEKSISSRAFSSVTNALQIMLLRADMYFQHKFSVENSFVCDNHQKYLLRKVYFSKSRSKCDKYVSIRNVSASIKTELRHVTVNQALILFEAFGVRNSYGKLICRDCREKISKQVNVNSEELHKEAFECVFDEDSICCVDDLMNDKDLDYVPPPDVLSNELKLKEQRVILNSFLTTCGSNKRVYIIEAYSDLSHRVQLRYVNLLKFIVRSVANIMAPYDASELLQDFSSGMTEDNSHVVVDGSFRQVMNGVSEAYTNAESWQTRREILSIIAPKITLEMLRLFIPGLTRNRFTAARRHAQKYGLGSQVEKTPKVIERFDYQQVSNFVDFIISPHVCTDLPFGEKVLKLSSGTELFVPNTIRNMGASRIIEQYLSYCKENFVDFHPLGKSSLFTILEVCKASTRKSLRGINYFAAEG